MSMVPVRVAGAEGSVFGGVPTVVKIVTDNAAHGMTYAIPAVISSAASVTVDWGDGDVTTFPSSKAGLVYGYELKHVYAYPGTYRVSIDPHAVFIAFGIYGRGGQFFPGYADFIKPAEAVEQWGGEAFSTVLSDSVRTEALRIVRQFGASVFSGTGITRLAEGTMLTVYPYAFHGTRISDPSPVLAHTTEILDYAFSESAVTGTGWWPSAVKTVPAGCFHKAGSLASLSGLSGVTSIEGRAFEMCVALRSLSGISSVVTLGDSCFSGCTGITSLTGFPSGAREIPKGCFEGCTGIVDIRVPGSVKEIRTFAFANVGARSITFSSVPEHIDKAAFYGQSAMGDIHVPAVNPDVLRNVPGRTVGGTQHSSSNPYVVKWRHKNIPTVEHTWFSVDSPTWGPWGVGTGWYIVTSDNRSWVLFWTICPEFSRNVVSGEDYPPSRKGVGSSRLDVLASVYTDDVIVYQNFSPYAETD